jgi:hypothetical protein
MNLGAAFVALLVAAAVFALFTLWDRWRATARPRYVDRLDIDDAGFKYTAIEPYFEGARWADVQRVLFYYGEPDFPDPLAGMAPIAEWQFVYLPDHQSADVQSAVVPHSDRDTPRLASACEKHLRGFDTATLRDVSGFAREGHWLLWERRR